MSKGRRGPSLFEVMNKSPLTQNPTPRPTKWPWQRGGTEEGPTCVVAEALTEEEAAAELAAEAEQRQKADRVRRAAKQAAEEAKQSKERSKEQDTEQEQNTDPIVQTSGGRLVLSLNTVACVAAAACICILALGAYSFGRRSIGASPGDGLSPVAAVVPTGTEGSPLLPSGDRPEASREDSSESVFAAFSHEPDVDQLLEKPSVFDESRVVANQAASVGEIAPEVQLSRQLNYLWIETFRVTRDRSGEQLKEDLADTRSFLLKHGVPTRVRQFSNGYRLYSEYGVLPDQEHRTQRDAFQEKVSKLGKTYRREGGLYEFKGCQFVSYSNATRGESVR